LDQTSEVCQGGIFRAENCAGDLRGLELQL